MLEHINDPGVCASWEDNNAFAPHVGGQEPLIHDERVVFPGLTIVTQPFVSRKSLLVTRDPGNLAADKKHLVKQDLRLGRYDRSSALGCEIIWRRDFFDGQ